MTNEELESELCQLRTNADNLSHCLHALLERIEQLEGLTGNELSKKNVKSETLLISGKKPEPTSDVQVVQSESITVDPATGLKKKVVVTERVLTTKTYHAIAKLPSPELLEFEHLNATVVNGHLPLLGSAYESRVLNARADQLKQIEVERICGEMVVTKVHPDVGGVINPGDTILEINGKPVKTKKDLISQIGSVQVKLVVSDVYNAPMEFVKVLANYDSEKDKNQPSQNLPIKVRRGEVLQVLSSDGKWIQARKVNDLSQCAFLPVSIPTVKVSMLSPYGRRTLVLLGAPGVGRRTLKSMLLAQLPNHFSTVVPITSRLQKSIEQEGRDYHYETKDSILKRIRNGQMVEWGELQGVLYGTSADSVRKVMRSGRVCVLDCSAKALNYLYNKEFMPFVVVIGPPDLEELKQMSNIRGENQKTEEELKQTVLHHEQLMKSEFSKYFDQVLINRNHDVTFKRLLESLENLKNGSQWVPTEWLSG